MAERVIDSEEFEGAGELADALRALLDIADADAGETAIMAVSSEGFAIVGWAVLQHGDLGYTIEISDKPPVEAA